MIKVFPILLVCLITSACFAQEVAHTQYYLNMAALNPGFTGAEDYLDVKLAFRQGWNDFGVKNDNLFVSAYGSLGNSRRLAVKRNSLRISNLPAIQQAQADKKLLRRHGIGGMMTNRNFGPYTSSIVSLNYAYHLPVSSRLTLSFGTKLGYASQRVNVTATTFTLRDLNDPLYQSLLDAGTASQNSFLIDFGTVLYSKKFYLGFSSGNLVVTNLSGTGLLNFGTKKQYVMQTGYTFNMGESLQLNSGAKLMETEGYDLNWGVNSRLRFKQLIYVGMAYENISKTSFLLGLSVNRNFSINYSYDKYSSSAGSLSAGVHELVVGIALFNKFESNTRFW